MSLFDKISVILFDLDNTLVFMDEQKFVLSYATNAASYFTDVFEDPQTFIHHLLAGTSHMVSTKSNKTNIEKFFDYFIPQCHGLSKEDIYDRFLNFYTNDFDKVKSIVTTSPFAPKIFDKLEGSYDLVIATNPLFPEIATKKRIEWAGLGSFIDKIKLITHGEQFTTTKPDLSYYKEILNFIGKKASDCLVVGNDLYNDGVASMMGMKFYQITDKDKDSDFLSIETRKGLERDQLKVSGSGTLMDFYKLLE